MGDCLGQAADRARQALPLLGVPLVVERLIGVQVVLLIAVAVELLGDRVHDLADPVLHLRYIGKEHLVLPGEQHAGVGLVRGHHGVLHHVVVVLELLVFELLGEVVDRVRHDVGVRLEREAAALPRGEELHGEEHDRLITLADHLPGLELPDAEDGQDHERGVEQLPALVDDLDAEHDVLDLFWHDPGQVEDDLLVGVTEDQPLAGAAIEDDLVVAVEVALHGPDRLGNGDLVSARLLDPLAEGGQDNF